MHTSRTAVLAASATALALLTACGTMTASYATFSQAHLPEAIKVPAGHKVTMETVGVGEIT